MAESEPPTVQPPLTRKAAMTQAVEAYLRCEELSTERRRQLITRGRVKTSLLRAIKLTFAFAHGYIDNPWSLKNLRALTRAWLRLGEKLFRFIYRFIRPRDSEPIGTFEDVLAVAPRVAV